MISIVIPFYNEQETLRELHGQLVDTLENLGEPYEIIFVDDGSTDGTFTVMKNLAPLLAIRLARNMGQTQALRAGIRQAQGEVVITLDGDLENDPRDIPKLLEKLDEGYDVVSGWRQNRWQDKLITRRLPSRLANRLISLVSGISLRDHGCTFKAYRRPVLERLNFSGDMHRLIAAYAAREGARVAEIPVQFEPRKHGKSKYGLSRIFKVLLDVLAFHFFYKYARRPVHFFGGAGFVSFFLGALAFAGMVYMKYVRGASFIQTPLPILSVLFIILGFQFILMGLLAEIFVRTYTKEESAVSEIVENGVL